MNLRPHHLLCIQKFTGHGYDEGFTRHMTALVERLRADPDTPVTLVRGTDDLCGACPNNGNGACSTLEKVEAMDRAALDICGLTPDTSIPWKKGAALARERILETGEFQRVCGSCEWFALCRDTERGSIDD